MREILIRTKTKILTLTAIAGALIMASEVSNGYWYIPIIGAGILTTSILFIRSGNEN